MPIADLTSRFFMEGFSIDEIQELSALADAMPQLVWIAEKDGRVVYYNSRVEEFAGAYRNEDGNWLWEGLLKEEDSAPTIAAWNHAVQHGSVYEMEHRVKMKDGSFRWFLSRAFPFRNGEGQILRWFGTATDIHEQKMMGEKIREAEEHWRTALEATEVGTWEYNPVTRHFYLSHVARRIRGLGTDTAQSFELHAPSIHPDDLVHVAHAMDAALARGAAGELNVEYRVVSDKPGEWKWLLSTGKVLADSSGRPQRVIGIMQDITEQKRTAEYLQYLATLTQNIADAVIGTDTDHIIINWNKGAEQMYGWKAEEALGKPARDIVKTEFLSPVQMEQWRHEFETIGHWRGIVRQQKKSGEIMITQASVAKVTDEKGRHIGGVAVNKDITAQFQADEKLRESEERFKVLTDTIPQIVWVTHSNGELEYLNDQWRQVTGQTLDEGLTGRVDMIHPDDLPPLLKKWQEAQQNGQAFESEYRLLNKDSGIYRWFSSKVKPVKDADGRVMKWIGAATDIQHFKDNSVLLEQQVFERTQELHQLNITLQKQAQELLRSNEDLLQFAHVASHDLKEPLRKIKTYGSRILDEHESELPQPVVSYLSKMESAATRMATMIDGVLAYSMLSATEQKREMVKLNQVMDQIRTDLEILFEKKGAQLYCGQLPEVEGASLLIYQLFYNLIGNSLKFSRKDVKPEVHIEGAIVDLPNEEGQPVPYAEIRVRDNGIGFDSAYAPQIFKTFTRLNSKDAYEGTGLGLSLCAKIVERHQGRISATGKENEGAEFTVLLPITQPH